MNDLYSEIILDYFKNPRQKGTIQNPTTQATETNTSCGDEISVYLKIDQDTITEAKFQGIGCAISQASTSMLMEDILNKKLSEITKLDKQHIFDMLGVEISPGRIKCALIGLSTLKKALNNN